MQKECVNTGVQHQANPNTNEASKPVLLPGNLADENRKSSTFTQQIQGAWGMLQHAGAYLEI